MFYQLNQTSSLFCSRYFGDTVSLFAQVGLDHKPPILYFPLVAGMTDAHHLIQLLFVMRAGELFWLGVGLDPQSLRFQSPKNLELQA
jgi:hypothetical protein